MPHRDEAAAAYRRALAGQINIDILKFEKSLVEWEDSLVDGLLHGKQDTAVQWIIGDALHLLRRCHQRQHIHGQGFRWLDVDADRRKWARSSHGRNRDPIVVRQRADNALGPDRRAGRVLEDRSMIIAELRKET